MIKENLKIKSEQSNKSQKSEVQTMKGFKQTEVGLIPSDWDVLKVTDYGEVKRGAGSQYIKYVLANGIRLIRINDFFEDNPVFVAPTSEIMRYKINEDDILFAGTGASAGASFIPKKDWIGLPHSYNAPRIRIKKVYSKDFLLHALQSTYVAKQQKAWFVGAAQPFLDTTAIGNIKIISPPTKAEQTAIATVLSDTDALIEKLEQLIAKKRLIKQGAMQELLKPKEGWEVKKLGEVADIKTGSKNNEDKNSDGEYPFFVRSSIIERIDTFSYDCEAILIPGDGNIGEVFHYIDGKFEVHQRVYILNNFRDNVIGKYIYLWFQLNFKNHAYKFTAKNTVDSLRLPVFKDFEIFVPSKTEQTRIAQILSDMDNEIEALEKQLEKYKMIKQGMMQVLLTGKIRLVNP
ncbi:MAG: restriction endonuclease subunit S [Tenuifilum sp.]|uniref:restriction endonuclease subunit S n=1 Tax=Tenuifilum sp. TaxID=2760880 RepID=UPI0030AE5EAE